MLVAAMTQVAVSMSGTSLYPAHGVNYFGSRLAVSTTAPDLVPLGPQQASCSAGRIGLKEPIYHLDFSHASPR
ncbi:MAG TPA: hypothetical protein VFL31_06525 [Nitrospiraceae bacterium]|nr:hypothetical protein [Nitrospiraceae bacterium]